MIALYDLSVQPSTYDFFNWLAHVKLLGATRVHFKTEPMRATKWNREEAFRRFENYIRPGPELAFLPHRIAYDGERIGSIQLHDLTADLDRLQRPLSRLKTVWPPRAVKYTVTIRETFHNPHKNSDRDLWLAFAERIGAHVIEDTSRKPISLYERVALCAGAKMNFGVTNGPMGLLYYTEYPFVNFADPVATRKSFGGHKISPGDQVPWFLPTQRFVWEKPTMDNLMREFDASCGKG